MSQCAALDVRLRLRHAEDSEPYLPLGRAWCPYRAALEIGPRPRPAEDSEPYHALGRARRPCRAGLGVRLRPQPAEDSEPYPPWVGRDVPIARPWTLDRLHGPYRLSADASGISQTSET